MSPLLTTGDTKIVIQFMTISNSSPKFAAFENRNKIYKYFPRKNLNFIFISSSGGKRPDLSNGRDIRPKKLCMFLVCQMVLWTGFSRKTLTLKDDMTLTCHYLPYMWLYEIHVHAKFKVFLLIVQNSFIFTYKDDL